MRLLVLQSAGAVVDLPERCLRWGEKLGIDVETSAALASHRLARRIREAKAAGVDGIVLERNRLADDAALAEAVTTAGVPVVAVSPDSVGDRSSALDRACARVIHGRGRGGFGWAMRHLQAQSAGPVRAWPYGDAPDQVGDLRVPPETPAQGAPLVVLFHGGFWRDEWERDLMDAAAVDLTARGVVTWNLEYRRMGPSGGGWPATLDDAFAAVTAIASLPAPLDPTRVTLLGHSAGAQLALCAAGRSDPTPRAVVGLASLSDLADAARRDIGWGSVTALLGDPATHPERYRLASPTALLPLGVRQVLVHGLADQHVPVGMTRAYASAAQAAGDPVEVVELPGVDHFQIIDPLTPAWDAVATRVQPSGRLLVDGMNVIGTRPDGWWRDRPTAAAALLGRLQRLAAATGQRITLVLEGRALGDLQEGMHRAVEVRAARRRGRDAGDDRIIELLRASSDPRAWTVVTSDRALRERARDLGARVQSASSLLESFGSLPPSAT